MFGLPRWFSNKESTCRCRRHRFDPPEGETTIHRSILVWAIPWTVDPGRTTYESTGSQRIGHHWARTPSACLMFLIISFKLSFGYESNTLAFIIATYQMTHDFDWWLLKQPLLVMLPNHLLDFSLSDFFLTCQSVNILQRDTLKL